MPVHEYKVIPAPNRPAKAKGIKTVSEKFALSLTGLMNEMGRDGWEYVRAETLPCEEKKGWMRRADTSFQTLLVFRREVLPTVQGHRLAPQPAVRAESAPAPMLSAAAPEGRTPPLVPERGLERGPERGPERGLERPGA